MNTEELLNFCEKHGVEISVSYDCTTNRLVIRMRKKIPKNERVLETGFWMSREAAAYRGSGLTLRVILREMAYKLDKEANKDEH